MDTTIHLAALAARHAPVEGNSGWSALYGGAAIFMMAASLLMFLVIIMALRT